MRFVAGGLAMLVIAMAVPAAAQAAFAPLGHPGPPLSVPKHKLRAALDCNGHVATADARRSCWSRERA
jgi:hypothetical protein